MKWKLLPRMFFDRPDSNILITDDYRRVAEVASLEKAQFILVAANSHYELLNACKSALADVEKTGTLNSVTQSVLRMALQTVADAQKQATEQSVAADAETTPRR